MSDIPADAVHETWDSIYDQTLKLAQMIEAHCVKSGEQFDHIVVIPRGAYYPVNIVARELGFKSVDLLHASIGSYENDKSERKTEFELGQMPTDEQVAGKNLLLVDEVCDSGQTFKFLTERFKRQGAGLVRTAVLHYKPEQSQTGFVPDLFVLETSDWIVYPWEPHDTNGHKSLAKRRHQT